ncbi:MAG: alanine--tRNA ligase, partial [Candidatus Omnitrophica bacterium]|nr:alanine--tRNA ligase [Candidatus Omnitrophota bacterium]
GPCGPCSEIFFDFGVNVNCTSKKCDPSCDCGRFSEIWNLVFTQYDRKEGGVLEPLPNKNIDTGMGLERLAAVIQGKRCNYEIDLFQPILNAISKNITQTKRELTKIETHIIADHIRAIVIGIADGVPPSNEGRGYVIKKLIIDITDIAVQTGQTRPVIYQLVPAVIEAMNEAYPDLQPKKADIEGTIENIENAYLRVRKERLPEFERQIQEIQQNEQNVSEKLGDLIFKYRDTYGLAMNTIEHALSNNKIEDNLQKKIWERFQLLLQKQQEQSRSSSKMTGDVFDSNALDVNIAKTQFVGYDHCETSAQVLRLFLNNQMVNEVSQGDHIKVILDKTPFYAESGGQIGDTGEFTFENGIVKIYDTQKQNDVFIHSGEVIKGILRLKDTVTASIETDRRQAIMRHHSATHLLQAALRTILGEHIKQQGSVVTEEKLRFDFTHHKAVSSEELLKIESLINEYIQNCNPVNKEILPIDEAKKRGALAFFQEKYGKEVRVISMADYSKEFCGGTHVNFTGEIGLVKIISEGAIAQGIRRIEAKAGTAALKFYHQEETLLSEANKILKTSNENFLERLKIQMNRLKQMEKDNESLKFDSLKNELNSDLLNLPSIQGLTIYTKIFQDVEMPLLRKISDFLKQKISNSIIILGAKSPTSASILMACSNQAIKKGFKANELIQTIAPIINGNGGGRTNLAQAGGKNPQKIDEAINHLNQLLKKS